MFKKIFIFLILATLIFAVNNLSLAKTCQGGAHHHSSHGQTAQSKDTATQAAPKKIVNAGNKICPVSGEKINEKLKATYEYKGKIYNLCCASCIKEFKKGPQKYIKKVERELQAESKEETTGKKEAIPKPEASQSMHEGHQH